jgi:hypothetical protein
MRPGPRPATPRPSPRPAAPPPRSRSPPPRSLACGIHAPGTRATGPFRSPSVTSGATCSIKVYQYMLLRSLIQFNFLNLIQFSIYPHYADERSGRTCQFAVDLAASHAKWRRTWRFLIRSGAAPGAAVPGLREDGLVSVFDVTEFFSWPLGIDSWPLQVPRGRVTVTPPMDGWAGAAHGQKYGRRGGRGARPG